MNELKYIRVMQHELHGDNIRIGLAFPLLEDTAEWMNKAESAVIESYEKNCARNGGFEKSCHDYYKRIALVDAETLEVLRLIYPRP